MLPVPLGVAEISAAAAKAAQAQSALDAAEEEEKARRAEHKGAIERLQATIRAELECVRTGTELRAVWVTDRKNFEEGTFEVVRSDNGEVVRDRPLTPEERQAEFDLHHGGKGKDE